MEEKLFPEIAYRSRNYDGEYICGDNFVCREAENGNRVVAILSDGMGHGVRANILSTFTSTMLLNFTKDRSDIRPTADMVLRMLPVSSEYGVTYSTFTIVDFDKEANRATIIQHDNPESILLRGYQQIRLDWTETHIEKEGSRNTVLKAATFAPSNGDRLLFMSDGITQSGQKKGMYRFGWGRDNVADLASYLVNTDRAIRSEDLASQIVSKAWMNDDRHPADDMSCAVIHFRIPRKLMVVSCPPALQEDNPRLAQYVSDFGGTKVICGYPVASILARAYGLRLHEEGGNSASVSPTAYLLEGFDLVSDGMIVPNRVLDLLESCDSEIYGEGIAGRLANMLIAHDECEFVIGLRRNSDRDSSLPDEFVLRRNILRQIISVMEKKWNKKVRATYF